MIQTDLDNERVQALTGELRGLLVSEGITVGVNLHLSEVDGMVTAHFMAVDLGRLGLLLASVSDPAELADPASLSRRITPGGNDGTGGRWQYELISGRYPVGQEIVFSVRLRLPASDLPELVSRLRDHR
jgi:hypothetical protein